MAIVEDKRGMQIGNMPSVDAVSQEGFIIYSDDGIHTYKMTIAEFAQAIGVVMTGGGDRDGEGEGLAYWIEEARRIYRDIVEADEFGNKIITVSSLNAIVFDMLSVQKGRTTVTNEKGYSAEFGNAHAGGVDDDDWLIDLPDYTDIDGNIWTNNTYPKEKYLEIVNAIATIRRPALNDAMDQPDSRYYCGLINKNSSLPKPYSKLNSQMTFSDIIINPLCKLTKNGKDSQGQTADVPADGAVTLEWDRLGAYGQDRVYFGTINLNVNHTKRPSLTKILGFTSDSVPIVAYHNEYADDRDELAAALSSLAQSFANNSWKGPVTPKVGTYEYYFTLYCIGNPNTVGQAMFTPSPSNLDKTLEVPYYPWTVGRDHGFMHEYGAYYGGSHDTSHLADYQTRQYKTIYSIDYPPVSRPQDSGEDARYINNVSYKDLETGFIFPSPYIRATVCGDEEESASDLPTPEYYEGNDPFVYGHQWSWNVRHYSDAFQSGKVDTYYDKADFGGAYFTDDEGTVWYILLTAATRDQHSLWKESWGTDREGVNIPSDNVINTVPLEFDKAPAHLNIPTMDHWIMDGVYDSSEWSNLDEFGREGYGTHIDEHTYTDPDTGEVTTKYTGYVTHPLTSIKNSVMEAAYENIQNIGKAVLNGLGLKGIKPLWPTDAIGIHSEISATSQSALNGGVFKPNSKYEETYNLDAINGSLYLKGDAYDNGKKLSDRFQEKLKAGENITIERDEDQNLVISAEDGGGGGSSSELTYEFDSSTKQTTISGLGDKDIHLPKYNGMYLNPSYGQRSGEEWINLQPKVDVGSMSNTIEGTPMTSTDPTDSSNKLYLDIKETYRNNTQRRLTGGKHVWLNNQPNTDGNTPSGSGTTSVRDTLYTDCIDTIKVDGVALTTQLDAQTGSHFVDIPSSGGGAVGNPFTIVDNYGGSSYVDSASNYYTNLGSLTIPNKNTYDGYLWVQAEAAIQIISSDTIAADSIISLEMRPDGFYNDLVSRISNEGYDHRSMILVDAKQIVHVDDNNIWTKVSICGMLNHTLSSPPSLKINVLQNSGLRKQVYWKAGIAYIPKSS